MAHRKIASLVWERGGLVIPFTNKVSYPDVSIQNKIEYLTYCKYTDIVLSLRDISSLVHITRPVDTNLSICINEKYIDLVESLFEKHCSKVFLRLDNIIDRSAFEARMKYLVQIYGASSFGANIHFNLDGDCQKFCFTFLKKYKFFSELNIINHNYRNHLVDKKILQQLVDLREKLGLQINVICELDKENLQTLKKYNFNPVNQFQIFTKWDFLC